MIILSSSYKSTVSFNITILFMQGDRSDLLIVAALDKSDLPDLPAQSYIDKIRSALTANNDNQTCRLFPFLVTSFV